MPMEPQKNKWVKNRISKEQFMILLSKMPKPDWVVIHAPTDNPYKGTWRWANHVREKQKLKFDVMYLNYLATGKLTTKEP